MTPPSGAYRHKNTDLKTRFQQAAYFGFVVYIAKQRQRKIFNFVQVSFTDFKDMNGNQYKNVIRL